MPAIDAKLVNDKPMNRYTEFDGGYLDAYTGLIWKSHPEKGLFTFEQALELEDEQWRLPTAHELFGVVDTERFEPATELPGHTSDAYWSSDTSASTPYGAWRIHFKNGDVYRYHQLGTVRVRLVRR